MLLYRISLYNKPYSVHKKRKNYEHTLNWTKMAASVFDLLLLKRETTVATHVYFDKDATEKCSSEMCTNRYLTECKLGSFGNKCAHHYHCDKNATCNNVNGTC